MRFVHTDCSEDYQQNEVSGKPKSGSGLKNLGWSPSLPGNCQSASRSTLTNRCPASRITNPEDQT